MQRYLFKTLLMLFIVSIVGSVQQVFSAEQKQEDLFSSKLTGDWSGERTRLAENGITIDIDMIQTYQGVLDGRLEIWKFDTASTGFGLTTVTLAQRAS